MNTFFIFQGHVSRVTIRGGIIRMFGRNGVLFGRGGDGDSEGVEMEVIGIELFSLNLLIITYEFKYF
jgi:hypothetical protein